MIFKMAARVITILLAISTVFSLTLFASALQKGSGNTAQVVVGYYAESLCPDCINLSNGPMNKAFQQVGTIFKLHYVPWGNAEVTQEGKFKCQHGPMECTINTVEACVIHYYPEQPKTEREEHLVSTVHTQWIPGLTKIPNAVCITVMVEPWWVCDHCRSQFWPFIHCMDSHGESQDLDVAKQCADSNNMDWNNIDTCTTGNLGHQLEQLYANETASLRPPHEYTPWVTVNGKHDTKAEGSELIQVICKAYSGSSKPQACDQF